MKAKFELKKPTMQANALFSLIFLMILTLGYSQTTNLSGSIMSEDGQAIEFANILLLNASDSILVKGTISDSTGNYFLEAVKEGEYLISATLIGYETEYTESFIVNPILKSKKIPDIIVQEGSVNLDEVVVSGQKPFMELKMDRLVMNVENSPVAAGNNALELLIKAPGVNLDQQGNLSLKGKQGVLVMIDGKNTYMSTEEVIRLLETMGANDIESIEIIHNPPAKYDAAGNAGIINIRLKKDRSLGMNGSMSLGGGVGSFPKANSSVSLNYRNKKVNIFGSHSYRYNKFFNTLSLYRNVPFEGTLTTFDQSSFQGKENNSHRFKVGADLFLNDKTTVGVLANGRVGSFDEFSTNTTLISGDNTEVFNEVRAVNDIDEQWDNYSYNVNVKHQFDKKGHELNFDADYSSFKKIADSDFSNFFFNENGDEVAIPNLLRSDNFSEVTIKAIKLDYTKPISTTTRLEAGLKSSFVSTDNGIDFQTKEEDQWVDDLTRTNQFLYDENIYAAYVNLSTRIKKVNIQMGLRGELTAAEGLSVTLNEQFERDYFSLFPSLSISHMIGQDHQLSYAYSRRIDRPNYQDLNPFIYFLDQYTFGKGNTNLGPQFSNSFGINYSLKGRYMVNFNYSDTQNAISEVIEQDDENKLSFQTKDNLASFKNYSLTISAPVNFSSRWTSRVNVSTIYNNFQSPLANGEIDRGVFSYFVNMSQNYTISEGFLAQLSAFYQSKSLWGVYEIDPRWSMDIGFSKRILRNKGTLKLNINDIFFTNIFVIDIQQGSIDIMARNVNESRRINVSFAYNFGNKEVKSARRRKTATEEEQSRANSN